MENEHGQETLSVLLFLCFYRMLVLDSIRLLASVWAFKASEKELHTRLV